MTPEREYALVAELHVARLFVTCLIQALCDLRPETAHELKAALDEYASSAESITDGLAKRAALQAVKEYRRILPLY